jgi:predicted transcriptional regulator
MKTYYTKSDAGTVESVNMTDAVFESVKSKYKFLAESSKEVKAYLAAQAEAAKPKSVTMRQARLALLEAGLLDNVQNTVAGMQGPEGAAARIEWEYSSTMVRSQPLITAMAAALKLTDADVDALFLSASTK